MKVETIKQHRYGGNLKKVGSQYDIASASHLSLALGLGRVQLITTSVPAKTVTPISDAPKVVDSNGAAPAAPQVYTAKKGSRSKRSGKKSGSSLFKNLFASGKPEDGVSCGQPGCLNSVSHPCEGCGRIAGVSRGQIPPKPFLQETEKDVAQTDADPEKGQGSPHTYNHRSLTSK